MAGLTNPMPQAPAGAPAPAAAPAPGGAPAPAAAAPAPGAQPQGAPQGKPIGDGPVDQDLYKKFVANLMNTVTGAMQSIGKQIADGQDKVGALAQATVQVVIRVEDSLEQHGGTLNLSMTFQAGAEAMTDIVDVAQKMGAYTFQQKEIDAAFLRAVNLYRQIRQQQGRLDQSMFQQKLAQLKQMDQQGALDQAYPGLTQFAQRAKVAAKPSYKPGGGQKPAPAANDQQPDAEDQEDGGDDEAAEGDAPATGSQDFPPDVLAKRKANSIAVKPHYRNKPKKRKAPKPLPGQKPAPAAPVKPKKGMV